MGLCVCGDIRGGIHCNIIRGLHGVEGGLFGEEDVWCKEEVVRCREGSVFFRTVDHFQRQQRILAGSLGMCLQSMVQKPC